jgi:Ca-activated chloride channel homolog
MDKADLALVLAVDGSASVTYDEFNLIAGGMGTALREPAVIHGLIGGSNKSSIGCLILWSGVGAHDLLQGWTRIASQKEALAFADAVENMPRSIIPGETAIGEALLFALQLLAGVPAKTTRQVVDVVGDGRSNAGIPPGPIRDRMAAAGITINGLCILHEEPDLLQSYQRGVIGGPGSFAETCKDYADFGTAMRRKLTREVNAPIA